MTRWLPLAALAAAMALVFAMGWHRYISFETIGRNYEVMKAFIAANFAAALAIYVLAYIAVVALSLPGGLIMTLAGGLLFGWQWGAPATVIAATIGATIVFLIAKSSIGDALAAKAGPWLSSLKEGFRENALSYLLFLRLVPAFPFVVVNLAPALLGVSLGTYILGTFLGIIPGTVAFSFTGSGLASVVEAQNAVHASCLASQANDAAKACAYTIDTSALVTRELLIGFALLGAVALIPVAIKSWSRRNG
ncbi:MAG: VTT domain-containing protein [Hyphomicrobium sp.]|nr:VTT domain-containing protein [Hyphomicrobium sp.]